MREFSKNRVCDSHNMKSTYEWKNEIGICLLTGVFAIIIFCMLSHIWNMDLNVPLSYSGDVSGLLIMIKSVLREESWWNFDGLGAPFHTNMWRSLFDGAIPNAIMFTIAMITKSVGYGINFYYILSYGLYGICTYYMLRKAGLKKRFSVIGAILYAFIPGHYQRGEGHIYVGSCFSIPLIIVTAMNLFTGKMCRSKYSSREKLTKEELITSNSREQNLGLLFLIIVTFCTIYYGIFSLILLTFCAVYCSITRKQLRHLYYFFQYVLVEISCLIIIYFPQIIANKLDPCVEKVNVVTRIRSDVEFYGGKLIQYILPVRGHRISILAKLREIYDSTFPLVNENGLASLGMIMSVGFLIALVTCFFSKEKYLQKFETHGKMELFLFFISTIGGLGVIVGFINYSLRCYNRFSYFIGAVGIIVSMSIFQDFCLWIEDKRNVNGMVSYLICLLILGIGIFDQTSVGMKYTKEQGDNLKIQYYKDEKFVKEIEDYEGEDAKILVFPIMNAQQSTFATTKDGVYTSYNEQILFIHSSTSDWSVCSKAGEFGERWLNWLENFEEEQIKVAAIAGFSGIAIYYGGYDGERLNMQLSILEEIIGPPAVIHDGGTWAYYSLSNVCNELLERYPAEKMEELRSKYLSDVLSMKIYNTENLYTTSDKLVSSEFILTKDTWQYGPYEMFAAGRYSVEIYGTNLNEASIDCVANGEKFELEFDKRNNNFVKYEVSFDMDSKDVEFRTFNAGDVEITIEKIIVTKIADVTVDDI